MSSPKFVVFKLKDLKIPALIVLIVVALFTFFIFKNKTAQTFAPSLGYQDGKYIAGISLSDAEVDVVVEVVNNNISSISLSGLDETSSSLYNDLTSSIDYINTYVTATQSLELPVNGNNSTATILLMDAVKIALSDEEGTSVTNTYEKVSLPETNTLSTEENTSVDVDDIFYDEFPQDDFSTDDLSAETFDLEASVE